MLKKTSLILLLAAMPALAAAKPVNINTANKDELMSGLNGITEQQASAIVEYRNKNGAYVALHDLTFADGPGPNWADDLISSNMNNLTVGEVDAGDRK